MTQNINSKPLHHLESIAKRAEVLFLSLSSNSQEEGFEWDVSLYGVHCNTSFL